MDEISEALYLLNRLYEILHVPEGEDIEEWAKKVYSGYKWQKDAGYEVG